MRVSLTGSGTRESPYRPDLPDGVTYTITEQHEDGTVTVEIEENAAALRAELEALKARSAEIEIALNIVPAWKPNIFVKKDEVYSHNGTNWVIQQDHTTAAHWEPGMAGLEALYLPQ